MNHYIRDSPTSRKGKGKSFHNCGDLNRYIRDCPTNPPKGNGKGKGKATSFAGKGDWGPTWPSQNGIKALCSLKVAPAKCTTDSDGFQLPVKTSRPIASAHIQSSVVSRAKFLSKAFVISTSKEDPKGNEP